MKNIYYKQIIHILCCWLFNCYYSSAAKMCSNEYASGRTVTLTRDYHDGTDCSCSLTVSGGTSVDIHVIENSLPEGCQYKLEIELNSNIRYYSCSKRGNSTFVMESNDPTNIRLKQDIIENTSGFVFSLKFTTENIDTIAHLKCNATNRTSVITSTVTSPGYTNTTLPTSTTTTGTQPQTNPLPTSDDNSLGNTQQSPVGANNQDRESSSPAIIGGAVGGVVSVCLLVIIGVVCIVKRRRNKRHSSETEVKNDNAKKAGNVYSNNPVTNSSDTINPIIIDDNDLYISADTLPDHQQNTAEEIKPYVEYAHVNKAPKSHPYVNYSAKCDDGQEQTVNTELGYILGPDGDNYTVVNK